MMFLFKRRKTTEEFIAEAILKHNGVYDYSKVNYCGAEIKIEIIFMGIRKQKIRKS